MFIDVDDPDDERLAPFRWNERALASRADKRDDAGAGLLLAEGDLVVERALAAGCRPWRALVDPDRMPDIAEALDAAGCEVFLGGDRIRQLVTRLGKPQPIVALFERPARPSASSILCTSHRLVVVEGVDNPANVGAIVRNAAGLGWDGLLLDHASADPFARRALRVAMGTAFELPHARTTDLHGELAAANDIALYSLTPDASALDIGDVSPTGRRAVLIGSERAGLSPEVMGLTTRVRIPMSGNVDSLNAAAATAVACYALA